RPGPKVVTGKWMRDTEMRTVILGLAFETKRRRCSGLNFQNPKSASCCCAAIEQTARKRVDEMGFYLIAYAASAVRKIRQTQTRQRRAGLLRQCHVVA